MISRDLRGAERVDLSKVRIPPVRTSLTIRLLLATIAPTGPSCYLIYILVCALQHVKHSGTCIHPCRSMVRSLKSVHSSLESEPNDFLTEDDATPSAKQCGTNI